LRTANQALLQAALEETLQRRTAEEWLARLEAVGIPAAPIHDVAQVLADPQLAARGMWHTLVDHDGTTLVTPGPGVGLDGARPRLDRTWPRLGEHQESVLRDWLGNGTPPPSAEGTGPP